MSRVCFFVLARQRLWCESGEGFIAVLAFEGHQPPPPHPLDPESKEDELPESYELE